MPKVKPPQPPSTVRSTDKTHPAMVLLFWVVVAAVCSVVFEIVYLLMQHKITQPVLVCGVTIADLSDQ